MKYLKQTGVFNIFLLAGLCLFITVYWANHIASDGSYSNIYFRNSFGNAKRVGGKTRFMEFRHFTSGNYNLFHIERSGNSNKINYDVNLLETGKPDQSEPIDIYRIRNENGLRKSRLSWLEKKFAYGVNIISTGSNDFTFQFAAYGKRNFRLALNKSGIYKVFTTSLGRQIEVKKLFVHITGGSILVPVISKIDLYGKDTITGKSTFEYILL